MNIMTGAAIKAAEVIRGARTRLGNMTSTPFMQSHMTDKEIEQTFNMPIGKVKELIKTHGAETIKGLMDKVGGVK